MESKEIVPVGIDKKALIVRGGTALVGLASLAIIGTLAVKALMAGMALFALGGVVIAGLACYKLLPLLGQKFDNRVLSLEKKEAQDHPIEQLENELLSMRGRAAKFKEEIKGDNGRIKQFEERLKDLKADNPDRDLGSQESKLDMNKRALRRKIDKYNATVQDIVEFGKELKLYKAEFELSQMELVKGMSEEEAKEETKRQLLREEAIGSIRNRLNKSFADLELEESMLLTTESSDRDRKVVPIRHAKSDDDLGLIDIDFEEVSGPVSEQRSSK
jgi:hypothetical protein